MWKKAATFILLNEIGCSHLNDVLYMHWVRDKLLPFIDSALKFYNCQWLDFFSDSNDSIPIESDKVYIVCPGLFLSDEATDMLESLLPLIKGNPLIHLIQAFDICKVAVEFSKIRQIIIPFPMLVQKAHNLAGIEAEYLSMPPMDSLKKKAMVLNSYLAHMGLKPYLYALGAEAEVIIQNVGSFSLASSPSSESISVIVMDRSMDNVALFGHHDSFYDLLRECIPHGSFHSDFLTKLFNCPSDAPFNCNVDLYETGSPFLPVKDALSIVRKRLIEVIQADSGIEVKVPKILGKVSSNQLSKLLDWGASPEEKYLTHWDSAVKDAIVSMHCLNECDRTLSDELVGIERILCASLSDQSNGLDVLIEQIVKFIPSEPLSGIRILHLNLY
jgi:hypothetical protein